MKILVTGSAGFIGYYLTKIFLECENKVIRLDDINANLYGIQMTGSRFFTINGSRGRPMFFVDVILIDVGISAFVSWYKNFYKVQ